jgi:hypothetical protein
MERGDEVCNEAGLAGQTVSMLVDLKSWDMQQTSKPSNQIGACFC